MYTHQYGPPGPMVQHPRPPYHQSYVYDMPPPHLPPPPPHLPPFHPSNGYYPPQHPGYSSHYYPPPFPDDHYSNPPPSSVSFVSSYQSPLSTLDNLSEVESAISPRNSMRSGVATPLLSSRKTKNTRSVDSGYSGSKLSEPSGGFPQWGRQTKVEQALSAISIRKKSWSTTPKPLPLDPAEAAKVVKRRQRNQQASKRARDKLVRKAEQGERLMTVLANVSTSFSSISSQLEKLHIANIGEQLRQTGVDTARMVREIQTLVETIERAREGGEMGEK